MQFFINRDVDAKAAFIRRIRRYYSGWGRATEILPLLNQWWITSTNRKRKITFKKSDEDAKMKELSFEEVILYNTRGYSIIGKPMTLSFGYLHAS